MNFALVIALIIVVGLSLMYADYRAFNPCGRKGYRGRKCFVNSGGRIEKSHTHASKKQANTVLPGEQK